MSTKSAPSITGMKNEEYGQGEPKDKIITIYSDFLTRITQFEELASVGSRLLVGFQQALGFLGRPPIDKTSTLADRIVKAHGSQRVLSYVEAGCVNSHDSVQNVSKLHMCHLGLLDHIDKAKVVVNQLECLLDDAASTVHTAMENDEDVNRKLDLYISSSDEEEVQSSDLSRPEVADYASTMAIIYSMVKQDYTMQVILLLYLLVTSFSRAVTFVGATITGLWSMSITSCFQFRIVSSLDHKTSPGELETYCQMWSLRPFVDDDIMHKAWKLLPTRP